MFKVCSVCEIEKHMNSFSSSFKSEDFLLDYCRACAHRVKERHNFKKELRRKNKQECRKAKKAEARSISKTERRQRTPSWLTEEHKRQINSFYREALTKTNIGKEKYHVDHILPLLGENVSGLHVPWNLQILEAKANAKKGNKFTE